MSKKFLVTLDPLIKMFPTIFAGLPDIIEKSGKTPST
jgi:hypothetical protein